MNYIRHNDPVIEGKDPFKNCKLERKEYAKVLTQLISEFPDGFVLAVNNEWGTGKTTFLNMWKHDLEINHSYETLYFNAWEHDYDGNPLIALLAEFKRLSLNNKRQTFKKVLSVGVKLTKGIVPILMKAIVSKYVSTEIITDSLEKMTEDAIEVLDTEVDQYSKRKESLEEFRSRLAEYINEESNGKPIIFFIDELDRCKPSYAVEILEQVKHFFSVKGIVFVLSIDKEQLGNSIKGFYGNGEINTEGYLSRFIDLEFQLPNPTYSVWINYLYEYYDFASFFNNEMRTSSEVSKDGENFKIIARIFSKSRSLTLREIEKIFSLAKICLRQFNKNEYVFPVALLVLIVINKKEPALYKRINDRQILPDQLIVNLENGLFQDALEDLELNMDYTLAMILNLYSNYYREANSHYTLLKKVSESKFEFHKNFSQRNDGLLGSLMAIRGRNYSSVSMLHLLSKINLTMPLIP